MTKLTNQQLITLLIEYYHQEDGIRQSIRSTMNIYTTILVTLIGGVFTITSVLSHGSAGQSVLFAGILLMIGGIIEICIAIVGYKHYHSGFRRQAETIVQQAKIESLLEFPNSDLYAQSYYWEGESILPESFLKRRRMYQTSEDFVNWFLRESDSRLAKVLYSVFVFAGIIILVLGVLVAFGILCI
jgi:hypothetical protein